MAVWTLCGYQSSLRSLATFELECVLEYEANSVWPFVLFYVIKTSNCYYKLNFLTYYILCIMFWCIMLMIIHFNKKDKKLLSFYRFSRFICFISKMFFRSFFIFLSPTLFEGNTYPVVCMYVRGGSGCMFYVVCCCSPLLSQVRKGLT